MTTRDLCPGIIWTVLWIFGACLCALGTVSSRPSSKIFWLVGTCLDTGQDAGTEIPPPTSVPSGWFVLLCLYHNWETNEGCACGLGTCVSASSCSSYVPEAYWDKTEADPLFRLLYCDGVPLEIGVGGNSGLKATLWKNRSVKFSRLLVPKIQLWSTRNSPPVP